MLFVLFQFAFYPDIKYESSRAQSVYLSMVLFRLWSTIANSILSNHRYREEIPSAKRNKRGKIGWKGAKIFRGNPTTVSNILDYEKLPWRNRINLTYPFTFHLWFISRWFIGHSVLDLSFHDKSCFNNLELRCSIKTMIFFFKYNWKLESNWYFFFKLEFKLLTYLIVIVY